jgi:hypothetical protein
MTKKMVVWHAAVEVAKAGEKQLGNTDTIDV